MSRDYSELLAWRTGATASDEHLIGVIRSGKPGNSERPEAAEILGFRRCREAIPVLIEMLREGWHTDSASAAWALAAIKDSVAIPHLERVYRECKTICAGGHLHWDDDRLDGILDALLRFRSEAELKQLVQSSDNWESIQADQELRCRQVTERLKGIMAQGYEIATAIKVLRETLVIENWLVRRAVEAITNLPWEESNCLVSRSLRSD